MKVLDLFVLLSQRAKLVKMGCKDAEAADLVGDVSTSQSQLDCCHWPLYVLADTPSQLQQQTDMSKVILLLQQSRLTPKPS